MSAAKVPSIRARMRQQEILTLNFAGPTSVVARRLDRQRVTQRSIAQRPIDLRPIDLRSASQQVVVARPSRPALQRQTLWQRMTGAARRVGQMLARIDAPGVTF